MTFWSEERVGELRQLWADGLSASQICVRLGAVSRNSIIGKANRLGLANRKRKLGDGTRSATTYAEQGKRKRARAPYVRLADRPPQVRPSPGTLTSDLLAKTVEASMSIPLPVASVGILDLDRTTCRWPHGDPRSKNFHFCGARPAEKSQYCPWHTRMAWTPLSVLRKPRPSREAA